MIMGITELENLIKKYRDAYWNGETMVSDAEYDKLIEELRTIDPNNVLLTNIEHGNITGKKITHEKPMLSLDKVYSKEDLMEWIKKVSRTDDEKFFIQPKYDGISCHYDNGIYSTRGNGYIGENITDVCIAICKNICEDNRNKNDFYGEIVIKKSDFKNIYNHIFRPNGNTFKNSRNAVAGILNNDDYMYYATQGAIITLIDYDKYSFEIQAKDAEYSWDVIRGIINNLDYPMDGIVVKIADKEYADSLGFTAHHPNGAMAFKFENASAETALIDIEFGMGKEYLTATAVFNPVNLNGVTISRAYIPMKSTTLPCVMNGDFSFGSTIVVERAGDVIPHIIEVKSKPLSNILIDKCPFCGSPIIINDSNVKCSNDNCRKKKVVKLYNSLMALGIKNVGEKMVDDMCYWMESKGKEISLLNWMRNMVVSNIDAISHMQGYGKVSATNIVNETRMIVNTTVAKFIASLGILNVGIKIGEKLSTLGGLNNVLKVDLNTLKNMEYVGSIMANRIHEYFQKNYNDIWLLSYEFNIVEDVFEDNNDKKTVCFTGAMRLKRSEMSKIAEDKGYKVLDNVKKGLDYLVLADSEDETSSKCVKAKKNGIKIIRENDFLNGNF